MWGLKKIELQSNFFEGDNFIKKCFSDFFEIFTKAINKTNLEVKKLSVPKVIVIGSESSGKSSLLEKYCKMSIISKKYYILYQNSYSFSYEKYK